MDEPYIGEIRPIAFNYAPKGWALCNGQSLAINTNQALFSLLGVQYGGNGTTTFNLPDLRGRVAVGPGQLAGGGSYTQGQTFGVEQVSLTSGQIPTHIHSSFTATLQTATEATVSNPNQAFPAPGGAQLYSNGSANAPMAVALPSTTNTVGNGQGHENRQPFLALNYVIALVGVYPSRQ